MPVGEVFEEVEGAGRSGGESGEICAKWRGRAGGADAGAFSAAPGVLQKTGGPDGQRRIWVERMKLRLFPSEFGLPISAALTEFVPHPSPLSPARGLRGTGSSRIGARGLRWLGLPHPPAHPPLCAIPRSVPAPLSIPTLHSLPAVAAEKAVKYRETSGAGGWDQRTSFLRRDELRGNQHPKTKGQFIQ